MRLSNSAHCYIEAARLTRINHRRRTKKNSFFFYSLEFLRLHCTELSLPSFAASNHLSACFSLFRKNPCRVRHTQKTHHRAESSANKAHLSRASFSPSENPSPKKKNPACAGVYTRKCQEANGFNQCSSNQAARARLTSLLLLL